MHLPNSRKWQKEHRIYVSSDREDCARPNCALTTRQLINQALNNDVNVTTHQGITEDYTIDDPNPLRTPTCDLIDFHEYYSELKRTHNEAVAEHAKLQKQMSSLTDQLTKQRQASAEQNPQQ